MPSTVLLKASGLQTSPNQLSAPEGGLIEASNVILKRDNTVEPRRGYKLYGEPFPSSNERANQLMTYKGRILRHYNNEFIQWDTLTNDSIGQSIFDQFAGTFMEPETGRRIRWIEAQGNLYFTTSAGVMKISALNASAFSDVTGYVTLAGGVAATDISVALDVALGDESDFFTQDSTVAYRAVWGYNDANSNLILGAPSQSVAIYNPLLSLLLGDFNNLLLQLDRLDQPGSLINAGNYIQSFSLPVTASATELNNNLIGLVKAIDTNIVIGNASGSGAAFEIAVGDITMSGTTATITPTSGLAPYTVLSAGDRINILTSYTMTTGIISAGIYIITNVTSTYFTFEVLSNAGNGVVTIATSGTAVPTSTVVSLTASATDGSTAFTFSLETPPSGVTLSATSTNSATVTTSSNETVTVLATSVTTGATGSVTIVFGTGSAITPTGSNTNTATIQDYDYEAIPPAFTLPTVPTEPTTDQDLVSIQTYLNNIFIQLQSELSGVIPTTLQNEYITPLAVTTTATTTVTIPIPAGVTLTNGYFLQLYRTQVTSATGTTVLAELSPGDEMALAYEAYPTAAQIAAGFMVVHDITLDGFLGADLYTNATTGVGILYANATPPIAKDINLFKNVMFYANISTAQTLTINLLGVQEMINNYDPSNPPTLTIMTNGVSNTYTFIEGVQEVTNVVFSEDATATNYAGKYFTIYAGNGGTGYYVWYSTIVSGVETGTDPAPVGLTGIKVVINYSPGSADTAAIIATKTSNTLSTYINDFSTSVITSTTVQITANAEGITTAGTAGTAPVTVTVVTPGNGQNAALNQVLLANLSSPAQSVDATSRSLVQVINENSNEIIYAYYLSGLQQVPGQILLKARSLTTGVIYIVANNSVTGNSFSPSLSPGFLISSISAANPTVITTTTAHGLTNGQQIIIGGSNSTPNVNGIWTVSNVTSNTFTIPLIVTIAGTAGTVTLATNAEFTSNNVNPNRIFYSQVLQPEAVPLLNYLDVGAKDEQILRIFPIRDSLFVLKSDGLFRISGQVAPWTVDLFDSATVCIAPDSVDVVNNLIFAWCTTGIKMISEAGAQLITRPIDVEILQLASSNYTNFYTATFGVGYESDSSFEMFTVSQTTDTVATICYRYSNLTQSWTTWAKTNTCGVINPADDKMYLGAGDTNYIEQERKSFDRTDYADREISTILEVQTDYLNGGLTIKLPSITNIGIGDVLYQQQFVTIYEFNQLLLMLSDNPRLTEDYLSLSLSNGADLNLGLIALATMLDADSGTNTKTYLSNIQEEAGSISAISVSFPTDITTASPNGLINGRVVNISGTNSSPSINGQYQVTIVNASTFSIPVNVVTMGNTGNYETLDSNFTDIKVKFNEIITLLNADSGVGEHTFMLNNTISDYETIITAINSVTSTITVSLSVPLVVGAMTIFNNIPSTFTYCPVTMGDPLGFKHLREATFMFENLIFTSATVGFATDLLPAFTDITFNGYGPGIFGEDIFGNNYFGGGATSAPFRTYIPRNAARCRYLQIQFTFGIARQKYSLFGITITGEVGLSSRAYR